MGYRLLLLVIAQILAVVQHRGTDAFVRRNANKINDARVLPGHGATMSLQSATDMVKHTRQKVAVILGPTATGKTQAAIEAALALKSHGIHAEIINADSMQVYRGFDVGTAKPTNEQMEQVKHHLFGFVEPTRDYNAASYVNQCSKTVTELHSRGVLPLVVGGTNMYIEGLIWPSVIDMPRVEAEETQDTYDGCTTEELYDKLVRLDPQRAAAIHQNDRKRITRSLDVIRIYDMKHSELIQKRLEDKNKTGAKYDTIIFAMHCETDTHKERIRKRTQNMIKDGIIEECFQLMKLMEGDENMDIRKGVCQSIAYKELIPILQDITDTRKPDADTIQMAIVALETATWQYARRQNTWIRNRYKTQPAVKVLHLDTTDLSLWQTNVTETIITEILNWHSSQTE